MRLEMEKDLETVRQAALLLQAENQKLAAKNIELQRELLKLKGHGPEQLALKIADLEQQLAARNKALFGKSSEKRSKAAKADSEKAPQHGHGPKEQPNLRAFDEVVELGAVSHDVCPHCDKPVREWDSQFEESEEIDVISRAFVRKTIKRKKARCECRRTIVTAPLPPKLFPGARYSIAFAALVVVSKYVDHLPLERQVKMMKRDGLNVDSQTLWDYTWPLAQLLKPAHQRLLEYVLSKPVIGADETWWRLMGASPRLMAGTAASGGFGPRAPMTPFATSSKTRDPRRQPTCCSAVTTASSCAMATASTAHSQRLARSPTGPPGDVMRTLLREQRSRLLVKQIENWALSIQELPGSGLRKAIEYMGSIWKGLVLFLDDARVPLHNNSSERALRSPVIGRVNYFGSRSKRGTEAAAILYSQARQFESRQCRS